MAKRDRRIKGCPNTECERHTNKYKYKATDKFCTICGAELIYVCAECFKEIEDSPDLHRYCENCKAEKKQDGGKLPHAVKEIGRGTKDIAGKGVIAIGETAEKGVAAVKENAPRIKEDIKDLAKNPKAQQVALEVAEIAKDGIKNSKVRKAAGVVIRAAKK